MSYFDGGKIVEYAKKTVGNVSNLIEANCATSGQQVNTDHLRRWYSSMQHHAPIVLNG